MIPVYRSELPDQDMELIRRLSVRWLRAAGPHNEWAEKAKLCTEFLEGEQWTAEEKSVMRDNKRAALTINRISPLFRLVMGYQGSNMMDQTYLPTSDSQAREDVAELITAVKKTEDSRNGIEFSDLEVFADGVIGGRGWWDARLCFDENDFGEYKIRPDDPFSIYVDPDCKTYDPNEGASYLQESCWTSIEMIRSLYGPAAAEAVENIASPTFDSNLLSFLGETELSPKRFFGQYADDRALGSFDDVYHIEFVDHQAKRVRLLETQYMMVDVMPCFIDLETGDRKAIPLEWLKSKNHWQIQACLDHANKLGNPLMVAKRPVKRIRWSVSCADILIHDSWSPYDRYTKIPYFPYFRRGKTRGMIEDLIDPQREINKKRSVMVDILNRNANSGWMYEKMSLDAEQKENLQKYGSAPGINIEYTRVNGDGSAPQRIEPGSYPQGLDRLEQKAQDDMFQISGINESALGQLDRVQSGRAIEARQRQAVLALQLYSNNLRRSKVIEGTNFLNIIQNHYTEERIFRVVGEDSNIVTYEINKKMATGTNSMERINDITVGRYSVSVSEVPMSDTFKQGQFEEALLIIDKLGPIGAMLAQTAPGLLIDMSSLPRKQEWKQALNAATAITPPEASMAAAGSGGQGMPIGQAAGTPEKVPS